MHGRVVAQRAHDRALLDAAVQEVRIALEHPINHHLEPAAVQRVREPCVIDDGSFMRSAGDREKAEDRLPHLRPGPSTAGFEGVRIYRGRRMINWDPAAQTAVSDEEVVSKPQKGSLYFVRYEVVEEPGHFLEVATTRPETIMADTAMAFQPGDRRYADLLGKHAWRPLARMPKNGGMFFRETFALR